ncbi:MAG: DUF4340 domain-containing protein [Thermodesulfobacteriota bacterium]
MKTKKELLIIALVAIALIAYLFLRKTDRTTYQLPNVEALSADTITRLQIEEQNRTVVLEKRDDHWQVLPIDRPADSLKVGTLTDALAKLELTALVSESGSLERYDLGPDKRIRVRAWAKDALKRDIEIGKTAPTYQHTFIRFPDSDKVYHARGNLRSQLDGKPEDFRNKSIFSFQQAEVNRMQLTIDGNIRTLVKEMTAAAEKDKPGQAVWKSGENTVETEKIEQVLNALSTLRCEKFLDPDAPRPTGTPILEATIEGKDTQTLQVFERLQPSDTTYPATSSGQQDVFTVPGWKIDQWKKDWAALL